MKRLYFISISSLLIIQLLLLQQAFAQEPFIDKQYILINKVRVDRTRFDFIYKVRLMNDGVALKNVSATVSVTSADTVVTDGNVQFNDIAAASSSVSVDTFTIRQNRLSSFNPNSLIWKIKYIQDDGNSLIKPAGGEVSLAGIAKVNFPAGAFSTETQVSISTSSDPDVAAIFDEFASIFRPNNRLAYEVRINTGPRPPVSDTIRVEITVPDVFLNSVPKNYQIELLAQLLSDGGEETIDTFEIFEASYNATSKTIIANLPTAIFSDTRNANGDFEAILILATTPGVNRVVSTVTPFSNNSVLRKSKALAAASSPCKAASIQCPLANGCTVTSPFSPARKHPVTGEVKAHTGVDYRAPNGSNVTAASNGTIEVSRVTRGYGETIVVRHSDGSATLYAHLQRRDVAVGDNVTKGDNIATSDNTGTSTGPHLHFEYVPNGQIFGSKNRIDPDACIDALASGSITVNDNGSLADDAFQVFLDNLLIGSTSIGASNTLALNNLIPGNHTLKITAIIAPDNVGTYEITLNDGLKFVGGGVATSGVLAQGASTSFTIVVPKK